MHVAFLLSVQLAVFSATALLFVLLMTRPTATARRMFGVTQYLPIPNAQEAGRYSRFGNQIIQLLHLVRSRLGVTPNEKLKHRLVCAGLREQRHIDIFFGFRLLTPPLLFLIWTFVPRVSFFWASVAIGLSYLAPDFWVSDLIRRRREKVRLALPDALDLMVVCVDAGLGVDQALLRAGQELRVSHPVIAEEFMQINLEQRAGKQRMEAWRDMADRTQLEVVRNFAGMLAQTDRFGTPITRALGTFADSLRKKRSQEAEEMAAKTTVKLIFPLVLFIFPSMFVVLLGPAAITIFRNLGVISK
jgi:tight adherence protein C